MTNRAYEAQPAENQTEQCRSTSFNSFDPWALDGPSCVNSPEINSSGYSPGLFATFAGRSIDAGRNAGGIQQSVEGISSSPDALNEYEQEMARFTMEQAADLEKLKREYVFEDVAVTESFIRNHRSIVEVLLDAVPHLRRCFGSETTLKIGVVFEDAGPTTASAVALWKGPLASARESLAKFDESWWLENVKRARGRILFDYELT